MSDFSSTSAPTNVSAVPARFNSTSSSGSTGMMTVGKRTGTDQPLTEHDVAERLDKAAARVLTILIQTREMGLAVDVLQSRYLSNILNALAAELQVWAIEPVPLKEERARPVSTTVHGQAGERCRCGAPWTDRGCEGLLLEGRARQIGADYWQRQAAQSRIDLAAARAENEQLRAHAAALRPDGEEL